MKKNFVIKNIPTRLPIGSTVLYTFLMYYFKVGQLWWGIFITLMVIIWILVLITKFNEQTIDLNKEEEKEDVLNSEKPDKSNFHQRLKDLAKNKK